MKTVTVWFFSLIAIFFSADKDCMTCNKQDSQYLCASNTLPINNRLCIDITEVPAHVYKDYLASLAAEFGRESDEFSQAEPNYGLWAQVFEGVSANALKEKFISTDELALMPIMGISFEQANNFAAWRTKTMEALLNEMGKNERAAFPKKFRFRLPSENEWARIRFLIQDKKMLKQLEKIAKSNESSFKLSKSDLMSSSQKIKPVYFEAAEDIGFYNVFGNVAEMTSTKGVAMGGSWQNPNSGKVFTQPFTYDGASAAVGLRMIFEIIE
ncbi:SUMF1/EgtB/PvdO family nonheme iron enzyme [Roseivirga sp.]|uniref:SUMF1/EgtB/PvdO family nonheme iron enzyme n=1 Tax=Roseivirga sp. TaxID=1964215 RepID=UPI003B51A577